MLFTATKEVSEAWMTIAPFAVWSQPQYLVNVHFTQSYESYCDLTLKRFNLNVNLIVSALLSNLTPSSVLGG